MDSLLKGIDNRGGSHILEKESRWNHSRQKNDTGQLALW